MPNSSTSAGLFSKKPIASARSLGSRLTKIPRSLFTVSTNQPSAKAMIGVPQAIDSIATSPKGSLVNAQIVANAVLYSTTSSSVLILPLISILTFSLLLNSKRYCLSMASAANYN